MTKSFLAIVAASGVLTACGNGDAASDRTEGPVVSSSETPRNDAVDTTPTTDAAAPTAGANSFTEGQAKGAIEKAGYSDVGALTQNDQGIWQGKAMKAGAEATVSVDYKGALTAQ